MGRGGGSIEDLWAFNEECVARAIYECNTPIISAVGHEIDFTIADFVADLRAPTPTGAAEMAVPTIMDVNALIENYTIRLNKFIKNMINEKFIRLERFKRSYILKNPMSIYEIKEQKVDNLIDNARNNILNILYNKEKRAREIMTSSILQNPMSLIEKKENKLSLLINSLKLLNPLGILEKGYSIIKSDNEVIKDASKLKKGSNIEIKMHAGEVSATVMEVRK